MPKVPANTPPQAPSRNGTPDSSVAPLPTQAETVTDIEFAKQCLEGKKVSVLKDLLSEYELDTTGRKSQLVKRLAEYRNFQILCQKTTNGSADGAFNTSIAHTIRSQEQTPAEGQQKSADGRRAASGSSRSTPAAPGVTPPLPPESAPPKPSQDARKQEGADSDKDKKDKKNKDNQEETKNQDTGNATSLDLEN